jgi:glycosyltransferase involved in cell wall biosynthesis
MKVLLAHNYYQEPGGEDTSFAMEAELLAAAGHDVLRYTLHNDAINTMSKLAVARRTIWNAETYRELRAIVRRERPAVVHFTNTFPLISPSAYHAAKHEGAAVVQSLRNYRLLCPNAQFLRNGAVCESCLGRTIPWPAVRHGCYRGSRAGSAVVAAMLAWHRLRKTWTEAVDLYYTLTEFARRKFIEGGLPAEKIAVKSNFIHPDPGPGDGAGGYVVFVGRLSPEKGIATLIAAWRQLAGDVQLKILGDGPQAGLVEEAARNDARICWLGRRSFADVQGIVGDAACMVVPSLWYEGQPRTIIEAFSRGTPVIASRLGSMQEIIDEGATGFLFEPGNAADLAVTISQWFRDTSRHDMRTAARQEFEGRYAAPANYEMLMNLYRQAIGHTSPHSLALAN